MQIQLKQHEIEAALRGYIIKQGISLTGRSITIAFTAGRGGNGLTVDMTIDDVEMPHFGDDGPQDDSPEAAAPVPGKGKPELKAVGNDHSPFLEAMIDVTKVKEPDQENLKIAEPSEDEPVKVTSPVKTGVSLFN